MDKRGSTGAVILLLLVLLMVFAVLKLPMANVIWMKEGEIVKLLNYHNDTNISVVELINVAGDNNRTKLCGFYVDGEQTWIEEGHDRELGGVRIYVRRIVFGRDYLEESDYCKVTFTKPIVEVNESASPGQIDIESDNLTEEGYALQEDAGILGEESNLSAQLSEENATGTAGTVNFGSVYEEDAAEKITEEPAQIGFFSRIVQWLKGMFG